MIGGQNAARRDDLTNHGGIIQKGASTVIIGDVGIGAYICACQAAATGAMTIEGN